MAICWICGKPDTMPGPREQKREMVELSIDGNPVNAHKSCAIDQGYIKPKVKNGRLPLSQRTGQSW